MNRKLCVALAGFGLVLAAQAQTKWDLPAAYPANNFHTENISQFAADVDKASGGKLKLTVHANARVGSNAVVLKDVPEGATVVGIPARAVVREAVPAKEFCAYGSQGDMPDPVARAIDALCSDIGALRARVAQLEGQLAAAQDAAAQTQRPGMLSCRPCPGRRRQHFGRLRMT